MYKQVTSFTNQKPEIEEAIVTIYRIPVSNSNYRLLIWFNKFIN